jgi:4-amino-4-deoxy-L-arabinose transferase-like glycosyltransferase
LCACCYEFCAMDLAFSERAARSGISPARWRRPFLIWMDGIEAGWAIPLLLIGFIAVWLAFLSIAYFGGDLHPDVLETWTLGRRIEWGYSKHPPLMGWVARAWTSVFPLNNWSFQLMALTNSAIALWAVDLITRRFARGDKRIVVLLLLMLLPTYQFHAQRFNANAVLLATWPIATYCFLRSFETREIRWAIAAGATAALAMLGKYFSVFLIVSFLFAAICHPQRRAYFASFAPWVSMVAGVVALAPHLHWLATTGAKPFAYALALHAGKALGPALVEALLFILGVALVLALPTATWVLIAGNRLKRLSQDFRAMNAGLLLLFLVSVGTIVFPAITSIGLRADMPPIWALQGLFLFPILIVCGASYSIERFHSVNLAVLVVGIAVVAVVVVAPVHALYRNINPLHEGRNFYQLSAMELTRQWHWLSDEALRLSAAMMAWPSPLLSIARTIPFTKSDLSSQTPRDRGPRRHSGGDGQPCALTTTRTVSP